MKHQEQNRPGVTRRHVLVVIGAAGAMATGSGRLTNRAMADAGAVQDAIEKVIGNATPQTGRITLELPQIAENGNTVPLGIEVDSPMTGNDHVKAVHVFAEGNPLPNVASFNFTPANGVAKVSTRMRLAKTQNVVVVAQMSDGSVYREAVEVKVTIGGCGG